MQTVLFTEFDVVKRGFVMCYRSIVVRDRGSDADYTQEVEMVIDIRNVVVQADRVMRVHSQVKSAKQNERPHWIPHLMQTASCMDAEWVPAALAVPSAGLVSLGIAWVNMGRIGSRYLFSDNFASIVGWADRPHEAMT